MSPVIHEIKQKRTTIPFFFFLFLLVEYDERIDRRKIKVWYLLAVSREYYKTCFPSHKYWDESLGFYRNSFVTVWLSQHHDFRVRRHWDPLPRVALKRLFWHFVFLLSKRMRRNTQVVLQTTSQKCLEDLQLQCFHSDTISPYNIWCT